MPDVREHIPLEQGLRLKVIDYVNRDACSVREHIPLEQGLRLNYEGDIDPVRFCQRAYSIRTRIKTLSVFSFMIYFCLSESIFH